MKYKYYFKKPKGEIVKDILKWLAVAGAVLITGSSPYFSHNLSQVFWKWLKNRKKYQKKKIYDTFWRLRKQGCIDIKKVDHQFYIRLTKEGKKKAGWMQIDDLKIKKPKKWDEKWRIVIFDISHLKKFYRDLFRGKLKELGFYQLQKSVWIHPFDCRDEIELLKDFFALTEKEIRLIIAYNIGKDNWLREKFKI